jgi:hypothetical protein
MSAKHEPGTVATATVHGIEDVRIFRASASAKNDTGFWVANRPSPLTVPKDEEVTDVRPLVVLDPEDRSSAARLLQAYGDQYTTWTPDLDGPNVDRLQDALRSLTKPPRIPEPGLWGVVEAQTAKRRESLAYVRTPHGWTRVGGNLGDICDFAWESLIDPTLIREGLS